MTGQGVRRRVPPRRLGRRRPTPRCATAWTRRADLTALRDAGVDLDAITGSGVRLLPEAA
jgi:hypothetical protein